MGLPGADSIEGNLRRYAPPSYDAFLLGHDDVVKLFRRLWRSGFGRFLVERYGLFLTSGDAEATPYATLEVHRGDLGLWWNLDCPHLAARLAYAASITGIDVDNRTEVGGKEIQGFGQCLVGSEDATATSTTRTDELGFFCVGWLRHHSVFLVHLQDRHYFIFADLPADPDSQRRLAHMAEA